VAAGGCERLATLLQLAITVAVRQQPVVAYALQARRQVIQQEAAFELLGVQPHHLQLGLVAVVLPPEGDLAVDEVEQLAASCWLACPPVGAAGRWVAREVPEVVASDGLTPRATPQSPCVPITYLYAPTGAGTPSRALMHCDRPLRGDEFTPA